MSEQRAIALQLCPFSAHLESELAHRFEVIPWFELPVPAQQQMLEQRAAAVRAVVTGGHIGCPNELMAALPALGIIAINGVGVDKVDLSLARARGVRVVRTPGVLAEDVADLAVGLVIGVLRAIPAADAFVRRGEWGQRSWPLARKVSGRRFGILGWGRSDRPLPGAWRPSVRWPTAVHGARAFRIPFTPGWSTWHGPRTSS